MLFTNNFKEYLHFYPLNEFIYYLHFKQILKRNLIIFYAKRVLDGRKQLMFIHIYVRYNILIFRVKQSLEQITFNIIIQFIIVNK